MDNETFYFSDLWVMGQKECEETIIACLLQNPRVLDLLQGWSPEVSNAAISFWGLVKERMDAIISTPIENRVEILARLAKGELYGPFYRWEYIYQTIAQAAEAAAKKALTDWFFLRAAQKGLDYVIQRQCGEAEKICQI